MSSHTYHQDLNSHHPYRVSVLGFGVPDILFAAVVNSAVILEMEVLIEKALGVLWVTGVRVRVAQTSRLIPI